MPERGPWRDRPPWWPEGEDWPRRGRRPPVFLLALIGLAVLTAVWLLTGVAFHRPWMLWPLGLIALVVVSRFGRPRFFPVGRLVDAAAKLAGGDYTVRVPEVEGGPLRQVIRSFNGMATRLEQSSQQRRQLLADLGHELRTPLTVIQGELEAMVDGVHPVDHEHLEMLLDETRLLSRLIDDLRILSLSESGELHLEKESIEVASLVTEAVAPYLASADRAGVMIDTTAETGTMVGDPFRLREVLANVITNAIRHTPEQGRVTVGATRSSTGWLFSVRDTGRGIAPDKLPLIFERFVKGADSRGTGLGLSIARELVRAHGGEMIATSVVGQGTVIEFTIPTTTQA